MVRVEPAGQFTLRFSTGEPSPPTRTPEEYTADARELVATQLAGIVRHKDLMTAIQKDVVNALPQPVMLGRKVMGYPTVEDAQRAMNSLDSSLEDRGIDEFTRRYLIHDLTAIATRMLAGYKAEYLASKKPPHR